MNRVTITLALALLVPACSSTGAADTKEAGTNVLAEEAPPSGAKLFSMHCTLCHGKDGRMGVNGAKDLSVSRLTREEMIALVGNGKGVMAPYKNVLTPAEIEAVVAHVRTLQANE